jgi:glycosyltransferase involved in cell wall biosynthesis
VSDRASVSVIVCTYNRSQSLALTLESLVRQGVPESIPWEILVVDNNSKDDTRSVVEALQGDFPGKIRYIFEPKQGLSNARNTGIRESRAEIVAFIDDDETADAAWLQNLTANLYGGEWAGAGGRVLPPSSFSAPRWLSFNNSFTTGPLSTFAPEGEAGALKDPPFGANMAFKREVFERHGGFRPDLGRSGKSLLSNEDTEFGRRLFAAGLRLRYEPTAVTYHPVDEARLRRRYFLVWWFNKGRSDVLELGVRPEGVRLLGVPVRLFRDAAVEAVRWIGTFDPCKRFTCALKIWAYAGQAYESHVQNQPQGGSRRNPKGVTNL